jgi:hypothetical protein
LAHTHNACRMGHVQELPSVSSPQPLPPVTQNPYVVVHSYEKFRMFIPNCYKDKAYPCPIHDQ